MVETLLTFSLRNTALHMAAWQNRSDIVELLIANGARVSSICVDIRHNGSTMFV